MPSPFPVVCEKPGGVKAVAPRTSVRLLDGCGLEEGLGGASRQLSNRQRQAPPQSKVLSGGWLASKKLFASMDFSAEVRLRNGLINPTWPLLSALRGAESIFKAADWTQFYVAPTRSKGSESMAPPVPAGCLRQRRQLHRRRLGNASQVTSLPPAIETPPRNSSRRLLLGTGVGPVRGTALVPLERTPTGASGGELLSRLCALTTSFRFVVVGTCDPALSDAARRLVAARAPHLAAQGSSPQLGSRQPRRGSVVVLTAPRCLATRGETALGLLRFAQVRSWSAGGREGGCPWRGGVWVLEHWLAHTHTHKHSRKAVCQNCHICLGSSIVTLVSPDETCAGG